VQDISEPEDSDDQEHTQDSSGLHSGTADEDLDAEEQEGGREEKKKRKNEEGRTTLGELELSDQLSEGSDVQEISKPDDLDQDSSGLHSGPADEEEIGNILDELERSDPSAWGDLEYDNTPEEEPENKLSLHPHSTVDKDKHLSRPLSEERDLLGMMEGYKQECIEGGERLRRQLGIYMLAYLNKQQNDAIMPFFDEETSYDREVQLQLTPKEYVGSYTLRVLTWMFGISIQVSLFTLSFAVIVRNLSLSLYHSLSLSLSLSLWATPVQLIEVSSFFVGAAQVLHRRLALAAVRPERMVQCTAEPHAARRRRAARHGELQPGLPLPPRSSALRPPCRRPLG
jgi:hypothetical protein